MTIFLGILLALGLGGTAFAVLRRPIAAPPQKEEDAPPKAPADPEGEELILYWTKASLALASVEDPYNPILAKIANARARYARDSSPWGQVVNTGMAVVAGFAPAVGFLLTAFNFVANSGWIDSSGGFEKLPLLTKQKLFIYRLGPYTSREGNAYYSQTWDYDAPKVRPQRYRPGGIIVPQTEAQEKEYREAFTKWVKYILVVTRKDAETHRMVQSYDEVMLPAVVIIGLSKNNMWPPPLEPISTNPLDPDFIGHYPDGNPVKYYASSYIPNSDYHKIVQPADPKEWQDADRQIADSVYKEIKDQYLKDAAIFSQITTAVKWKYAEGTTAEINMIPMAETAGCIPAIGTPANPRPASRRRGIPGDL